MRAPHKHAELIKAWADGAEIQSLHIVGDEWLDTRNPAWGSADFKFRIKPEKKPDVVRYLMTNDAECGNLKFYEDRLFVRPQADEYDRLLEQVKLIWDGETGKLKDAEVLK